MPSEFYLQGKGIKKTPTQPTEQTVATPTTATPTPTTPTERGGSSFYKQGKTQLAQIAQPAPQQPQKGFLEKAGDTLKGIGEFAYEAGRGFVGRAATMLGQEVGTVEDITTSVTQGKPLKSSAKVQLENLQTELQTGKKIERNVVEKAGQEIYNFEAPVFGSLRDIVEGIGSILPEGTPIQEQLRAKKERLNEELKIYEDNAKFTNDFTLVNRTKAQLQGIDSEIAFWDEEKKRKETGKISQITENLFANSPNLTDEERKQKAEEVKKLEEILKRKEQDDKDLLTVEGKLKKYGLDTVKDANQQRKQLKEKYGNPDFWTPQGFLFAAAEQATDIVEGLGTAIAAANKNP